MPALKAERPSLAGVQSQVLQHVAVRIDLAFKAFCRRCAVGEAPGSPRVGGTGRSERLTVPQVPVGCNLDIAAKRLRIMHVGQVQVVLQRPLEGTPKTATIGRSRTGKGSVSCSCAGVEPARWPETGRQVGIDVGLTTFATLSTEQEIAHPRCCRAAAALRSRRSPRPSAA